MYTLYLADLARQKGDQQEAALLEAGAKEAARVSGVLRSATTGPKHSSENKDDAAEEVLGQMTEVHWPPSQTIDADLAQRIQTAEQHLAELRCPGDAKPALISLPLLGEQNGATLSRPARSAAADVSPLRLHARNDVACLEGTSSVG